MTKTLRALTISELLDRTFLFYRRRFVLFLSISALPNLLGLAVQFLQILAHRYGVSGNALTWYLGTLAASVIASTFSQGATVIAVSRMQLGQEISLHETFGTIRSQFGELIIVVLNVGVRVGIGLLLLIVPGIIQAITYALTIPVTVLEHNGISASLLRSRALTTDDRGRIFVICALLLGLVIVGSTTWQVSVTLMVRMSGATSTQQLPLALQIVALLGSFAQQSFFGPILTIALTLLYYDERIRKEAFDLEHMMRQLDQATTTPTPIS